MKIQLKLGVSPEAYVIPRVFFIVPLLSLLLVTAPTFLAAGANNLASRTLIQEWLTMTDPLRGPPQCRKMPSSSTASRFVRWALFLSPDYDRALINSGRVAWLEGDCATTATVWQRALERSPRDSITMFWLLWITDIDAANVWLDDTLSAQVVSDYAYHAGRHAQQAGSTDAALAWYEWSLLLQPNREAAARLAHLLTSEDRSDQVLAVWERLVAELTEENVDYWWAAAQVAELTHNWEVAALAYRQGADLAEAPYDYWISEGRILRQRLGHQDAAEQVFLLALAARPEHYAPYLHLGHVYYDRQDYSRARVWYEEARVLAPDDHNVLYHLSRSLHQLGESSLAVSLLAQAIDIHPGKPASWAVLLGDWHLELGNQEDASAAYHRALAWNPSDSLIVERIAQVTGGDE